MLGSLGGECAGHRNDAALGGGVSGLPRPPRSREVPSTRRVDDRSTAFAKKAPRRVGGVKNDVQLDADDITPQLELHLAERSEAEAGGVVVESVDAPELHASTLDPRANGVRIAEVNVVDRNLGRGLRDSHPGVHRELPVGSASANHLVTRPNLARSWPNRRRSPNACVGAQPRPTCSRARVILCTETDMTPLHLR